MVQAASELSKKALADTTNYDLREVGEALSSSIEKELYESVRLHQNIIDETEFCVVMVIASDPLIKNLIRRKFYCWPYLPKPRPNQAVFLYNKNYDKIIKRLWVLPSAEAMAVLAGTNIIVDRVFQTMQAWSVAFFKGTFWEYVRHDQNIPMLSEKEYLAAHRDELVKASGHQIDISVIEPFDFSKIQVNQIEQSCQRGVEE